MNRRSPWSSSAISLALLWVPLLYVWVLPLVRPRGFYLWGLQLRDLYVGVPLVFAAACVVAIHLCPQKLRRHFAVRAAAITLGLCSALFIADAFFSLGYGRSWEASPWFDERSFQRRHHVVDAELGYVKKPQSEWRGRLPDGRKYVWRTDENGFRNPRGLQQADLVFVGDSYTEALEVPVDETFVHLTSSGLKRTAANLGRAGYGPQQQLITLKRYGLDYRPKQVVWQVFEGNDLSDAEFFDRWKHGPGWPTRPLWQRYVDNSLFRACVEPTLNREKRFEQLVASLRNRDGTLRRTLLRYPYRPYAPEQYPVGWQATMDALQEGHELCQELKIDLRVVFVPAAIRVRSEQVVFDRAARKEDYLPTETVSNPRDFGARLGAFCDSRGLPYLDLFPRLKAAAKTHDELFLFEDEHFAPAGHQLVAGELQRWIGTGKPGN